MSPNQNMDTIIQAKGYALSFEPVRPGTVVCRASKGTKKFQVLAKSVPDGLNELGRMLGCPYAGWRIS